MPLIIFVTAILLRFFLIKPLSLEFKRVLDVIIYISIFVLLVAVAFRSKKKEIEESKKENDKKTDKKIGKDDKEGKEILIRQKIKNLVDRSGRK